MKWEGEFGFITKHDTRLTLLAVQFKVCAFQQTARFQINHFAFLSGSQIPNQQTIRSDISSNAEYSMSCLCSRIK